MSGSIAEILKREAEIHAQEARTANATIAEIYQLCTGATGEPGNWNGANPVREKLATLEAENARLKAALEKAHVALISGLKCTCSLDQCERCAEEFHVAERLVNGVLETK